MSSIRVFDPAMCCPTGVCGPAVDPKLVRFAADLDWLKSQGIHVERFNLAQEPAAFAQDAAVKTTLEARGEAGLPLIKVDGEVRSTGTYPSRQELADWAGLAAPTPSLFSAAVAELVALGASVAADCEPCFKFHHDKAKELGVSREDMLRAVEIAQRVKESPARAVREMADRLLKAESAEAPKSDACCTPAEGAQASASTAATSACCTPSPKAEASTKKKCC